MDGQTHLPRSQATTGSFSASPLRAQCLHLAISSMSRSACEGGRGAYVMCEGGKGWYKYQGGVTPIDSIVTAATVLSQRSTVKPPK